MNIHRSNLKNKLIKLSLNNMTDRQTDIETIGQLYIVIIFCVILSMTSLKEHQKKKTNFIQTEQQQSINYVYTHL